MSQSVDFLSDWAAIALATPGGFAQWHAQMERLRVGWQLDAAFRLVREAKQLSLPDPAHALVLHSEAMLHTQTGNWSRAVKTLIQAIERLEDTTYAEEGLGLLLDLGMLLRLQGNFAGAEAAHEQALALAGEIEDEPFQAEALGQLGLTALHQEKFIQAIANFEQALSIQQRMGDRVEQARIHNHLGDCYRRQEELTLAKQHLKQALDSLPPDDPNSHLRGQILGNLGGIAFENGEMDRADALWREAMGVMESLGAIFDKAGLLNNLGGLALQQERYADAQLFFQESFALSNELGDERGKQESLSNLVRLLAITHDPEIRLESNPDDNLRDR